MAGSKFAYVRTFELPDALLPSTFLVIRLDGKGFHKFSAAHDFDKPNDANALTLMNLAAKRVMDGPELNGECVLGFGESDEFSFVFKKGCQLHGRRASKLTTLVTSLFTSAYVFHWPQFFPNSPLQLEQIPVFDGRIVAYPSEKEVKDYLSWRQVDTHINNMYNTCFWSLVLQGGRSVQEANKELSGTVSSQKQELLFKQFGINYNDLPPMFRKGSILLWQDDEPERPLGDKAADEPAERQEVPGKPGVFMRQRKVKAPKVKRSVVIVHEDLIGEGWWTEGRGKGLLAD